jgi:hypothetical protein
VIPQLPGRKKIKKNYTREKPTRLRPKPCGKEKAAEKRDFRKYKAEERMISF